MHNNRKYWNRIAEYYQDVTDISIDDFHYGPMIPGDRQLKLLPKKLEGLKCLEIGCGAAQNSIYLAGKGAACTAFDISEMQLAVALKLIAEEKVKVKLHRFSMDGEWSIIKGKFDLIHSTFGICFSKSPESVLKKASSFLKKGGKFIFSLEHPISASEKLHLDDDPGVFVKDYFNPLPRIRVDENDKEIIRSNTYPLSRITDWIADAGLQLKKIVEPKAQTHNLKQLPYISEAWIEEIKGFENIPPVIIFVTQK